jgi:hypothetical protein
MEYNTTCDIIPIMETIMQPELSPNAGVRFSYDPKQLDKLVELVLKLAKTPSFLQIHLDAALEELSAQRPGVRPASLITDALLGTAWENIELGDMDPIDYFGCTMTFTYIDSMEEDFIEDATSPGGDTMVVIDFLFNPTCLLEEKDFNHPVLSVLREPNKGALH